MGNNGSKVKDTLIGISADELFSDYTLEKMFSEAGLKYLEDQVGYDKNNNSLNIDSIVELKVSPKKSIITGSKSPSGENFETCPFYMNKTTFFITNEFSKFLYKLISESADNLLNEIANNLNNNPESFVINNLFETFKDSFERDSKLINLPIAPVGIKSDSNITGYKFYSSDFNFQRKSNDSKSTMNTNSYNEEYLKDPFFEKNKSYRTDIVNFLDTILNESFKKSIVNSQNYQFIIIKLPNSYQISKYIDFKYDIWMNDFIIGYSDLNSVLSNINIENDNFIVLSIEKLSGKSDLESSVSYLDSISIPILDIKINNEKESKTFNLDQLTYYIYYNPKIVTIKQISPNENSKLFEISMNNYNLDDKFKFMSKKNSNNQSNSNNQTNTDETFIYTFRKRNQKI